MKEGQYYSVKSNEGIKYYMTYTDTKRYDEEKDRQRDLENKLFENKDLLR